jgi:hypothetical protein
LNPDAAFFPEFSMRRVYLLIFAALPLTSLAATAATPPVLQADQSPTMPAPGNARGGKLGGLLTGEQRAMLLFDARDKIKDMSPEQRKTFRKDQIARIVAMSPAERGKFQAGLQARWDALPQGQKDRIQQRLAGQTAQ